MRQLLLGTLLVIFWLFLSGYFSNPLLLMFGVMSVAFALYIDHRIARKYPLKSPVSILWRFPKFAVWLVFEVIKANIAVVKNIWLPRTNPINPTVSELKMRQRTPVGQTVFANAITLTPGTVSFDITDNNVMVHAIVEEAIVELGDGEMNQRVADLEVSDS